MPKSEVTPNGYDCEHSDSQEYQQQDPHSRGVQSDAQSSGTSLLNSSVLSQYDTPRHCSSPSNSCLHDTLR